MEVGTQKLPEGSFMHATWGSLRNALIGCSAAIIFGLVVLLMSISSVVDIDAAVTSPVMAREPSVVKVQYYLPYPGILPDSPIYKLKMARDWSRLTLTFDEMGKADLELLFADKRIGAAMALMDGGKPTLAASTASKAEKYLESAINRTLNLQDKGQDEKSRLLTLQRATLKHTEILELMLQKASAEDKKILEPSLEMTKKLSEKVSLAISAK